ncbi:MAG: iron-sulfur cluster assembly accessory protein [Alphaproteobacteria bacterium]|nr:iron-sulfur cluster assembly accessory protein [Alphaproteobacteria bacterium]NCQ67418.1 iron-sulfur cluster assembly accessory protein [Alphaproteobacteria bacterium]NCT08037.1 iron-sulfur cluster assembly accessory protein [Alphaproteobacteria bacterium]
MTKPDGITDGTLYITDTALDRLRFLKQQEIKKNPTGELLLRLSVLSGGCSGFQYKFDFEPSQNKDDLLFTYDDISVITDEVSFEFLKNVTLDYVTELIGAAFTLRNPNVESSCGCGNSFSI